MATFRARQIFAFSFILLSIIFIISLVVGRYSISLGDLVAFVKAFFAGSIEGNEDLERISLVLLDIRLPRVLAAIVIGAALSVSGAILQSLFVNPLVSPKILGVLDGASFGAALGILIFNNWFLVQVSTFFFGIVALLLTLLIATLYRNSTKILIVLGGMVTGALFMALLSLVKLAADPNNDELATITFWLMGSLANADSSNIMLKVGLPLFLLTIFACFFGKVLNMLAMGDDEAKSLGLDASKYRVMLIIISALLSSATVVIAGNIGWVGLIIPHIARIVIGPDNRKLLTLSAIFGACFLLIADLIVRNLFSSDLPIGIVTSIIGIITFLLVIKNSSKGWN